MDVKRSPTETNQHLSLEIHTPWLKSIKDRADMSLHREPPSKPTIFRVPPDMRCGNPGAYEPKLVSIGPYHRGKSKDLKAMEELKWRLLHHYLSKVPNWSMNEGLTKLRDLEKQARDCYSEVIDINSDQFVEMLLLDGCFLVQIFMGELQAKELRSLWSDNMWFDGQIKRDVMLLENQLPYFIIEHLLDTLMPRWDRSCFQKRVIHCFSGFLPQYSSVPSPEVPDQGFQVDHLLHLFHKWILNVLKLEKGSNTRSCSEQLPERPSQRLPPTVPSTTELAEAGVKIKVRQAESFLHISFCKDKGLLEIPAIVISDDANFFFANLTAWEQCCPIHGMDVTHYTLFLDDIINTPRDVELLHQKGIIHRCVGADEDIASVFNKLGTGVVYDLEASYLKDVYRDLDAYCQSRWPRWRAKAMHDYFGNPWSIISLGAAVLLIGLTILQSVYTILSYYK